MKLVIEHFYPKDVVEVYLEAQKDGLAVMARGPTHTRIRLLTLQDKGTIKLANSVPLSLGFEVDRDGKVMIEEKI